ncbi:hypothetical protein [Mesorhizobium sp. WSM4887]|uniref:hypothetical protein n=1 Tax=Mesorhizobium sp. WSM4887 TaxID=3038543 RepID=UPI002416057C|nr:hypothetical protein [Mesorhizobium sp. WSM4887]MDG4890665.1 hypothetical protein [Mesorhizobium sp. WSM4887]
MGFFAGAALSRGKGPRGRRPDHLNQLARHRREIAPDLDLGDAAALIETLLENVVHRAIERHPVSVAGERAMDQCRRMIMAYLTSVNRHAA